MFFGVWTEECLTSVRTFCQRWQPWVPCAQETNMNERFLFWKFRNFFFVFVLWRKTLLLLEKTFRQVWVSREKLGEKSVRRSILHFKPLGKSAKVLFRFGKKVPSVSTTLHSTSSMNYFEEENLSEKSHFFFLFGRWGKR